MRSHKVRLLMLPVAAVLLVLIGFALAQMSDEVITNYRETFGAPVDVVRVERSLIVTSGDGEDVLFGVLSFRDGNATCYILWGNSPDLSCR